MNPLKVGKTAKNSTSMTAMGYVMRTRFPEPKQVLQDRQAKAPAPLKAGECTKSR
jgi:hypothetical protein